MPNMHPTEKAIKSIKNSLGKLPSDIRKDIEIILESHEQYRLALEHLMPMGGGSEYYFNLERCVDQIKYEREKSDLRWRKLASKVKDLERGR